MMDIGKAWSCGEHKQEYYHGDVFLWLDKPRPCPECGKPTDVVNEPPSETLKRWGRERTATMLNLSNSTQITSMARALHITSSDKRKATLIRLILWNLFDAQAELERIRNYTGPSK